MQLLPKLLVMCERIVEVLEIVNDVLHTLFNTNRIGAKECAAHHGTAVEPSSADWKSNKNTMKHYTLSSATPIGANTMFLQIGKCYIPFLALRQFFQTLPII